MSKYRATATFLLMATSFCAGLAGAVRADTLLDQTNAVGLPTVAPPSQFSFTETTAEALTVTLTDLGEPAAFQKSSLQIAVTLNDALVGSAIVDSTGTATVAVPAATGNYTLHVVGLPDATQGFGSFGVCVAPTTSPTACITADSYSDTLTTPTTATTSGTAQLNTNFLSTTPGLYTVTITDDAFPVALTSLSAIITQGSQQIGGVFPSGPAPAGTATQVTLAAATAYQLLAVAIANTTTVAGLYGIQITDPSGNVVFGQTLPVGGVGSATIVSNPSAQALNLSLTDYGYPAALASLGAEVTAGGTPLGGLTAAGTASNITAPGGSLSVWTYAQATTVPGVYSLSLSGGAGGSGNLLSTTQVVNPPASAAADSYAFVVPSLTAGGTYTLTTTDFAFPAALAALSGTIAQGGAVLTQSATGEFTASQSGVAIVLVNAQPPANGNGIFGVSIQDSANNIVFDQTQAVGGVFTTQTINVTTAGDYNVTLADLGFPTPFENLAVLVSQGSKILGKVFSAGSFAFTGTTGQYEFTFVATPGAQNYGLYSINVASAPPTITFTASAAAVTAGQPVQLTWSTQDATACTAAGASTWSGTEAVSGTAGVTISATSTLTLTCTGPGGSATKSVTVTANPVTKTSSGGGGALDLNWLLLLAALAAGRLIAQEMRPRPAGRRGLT